MGNAGGGPSVASEPNDLAGKRRGFRSRSTPGNRNKNGIKPIGLDKDKLNTPLPTPSARCPATLQTQKCLGDIVHDFR